MHDVTRILSQIESGDPLAAEKLLPLVYDELRKLAAACMANEEPGQTLQPTAPDRVLRSCITVALGYCRQGWSNGRTRWQPTIDNPTG